MTVIANLRILVIEDDPRMVELLRTGLAERGHSIATAATAEEGQRLVDRQKFDAIVLDIGLPGRSGYAVAEHLRERPNRPAILMLTALNREDQVVSGLDAGADDYLTKPFSFPELVARIHSASRRARLAVADDLTFGPFVLDTKNRRLLRDRTPIHITRGEYLLLRALTVNRGEVVSRRQLMQAIWGTTIVSHGALDTLVNAVREKLNPGQPGLIVTIRGTGYSLADETGPRAGAVP